uniref:Laminin EGF-like domain-containing protein n=1 Tax=Romanomermis culicivorax TaxID=13658 RepID=A0A915HKB7_ROMCU
MIQILDKYEFRSYRRADGCFLDADNEVVCTGCPEGHTGKHCDECQDGFKKDSENICKKEENTDVENSVQLRKLRKLRKLLRRSLKN